jgi:hypothetical protein
MQLLIDTDAFCKLAICDLFDDSLALFDADRTTCARLPALPHQLARGGIRRTYGAAACDRVRPIALELPVIEAPSLEWLNKFASVSGVDPGEAQLLAKAADDGLLLITGDKRALMAARSVEGLAAAVDRRLVSLEAVLLAHSRAFGAEEIRRRVKPIREVDTTVAMCFSDANHDPGEGLRSYLADLAFAVDPLRLWRPPDTE